MLTSLANPITGRLPGSTPNKAQSSTSQSLDVAQEFCASLRQPPTAWRSAGTKTPHAAVQGYVPLRTVCSFSRMTDALGLRKGMKAEQIREGLLKEVAQALMDCPSLVVDQETLRVRRSAVS